MASKTIAFEVIENSGPNNLRDTLRAELARASEVCIAVAFVTKLGIDKIIQPLRQVAARGKVRLVTGLYQRVTEPKALKILLRIQTETRGNFSVRLSREPQFHKKVFLLENRTQGIAIVGSSNLSGEGLRSGGELNLMVSVPTSRSPYNKLKEAFEKDWTKRRAVSLTAEQIERYANVRLAPSRQSYTESQLKRILGAAPIHEKATADDEPINFWQECITGYVKKPTEKFIDTTTNWDDKKFDWFSTGGPHHYRIQDRILIFDKPDKRFKFVEVKDITRTSIPTPDGRHFVAFKQLRKCNRRFTNKLNKELASVGIRAKNVQKKISPEAARLVMRILQTTKGA